MHLRRAVAILAPRDAAPFLAAAERGVAGTLTVAGAGGGTARCGATNLIAQLDRGAKQTLVISTPRSGWFDCVAERGSGLAVWLWLARSLAAAGHSVNLEFLATSGYEYDYLGGEHYLANAAPPPAATRLWVHIGASAAARDWHKLVNVLAAGYRLTIGLYGGGHRYFHTREDDVRCTSGALVASVASAFDQAIRSVLA